MTEISPNFSRRLLLAGLSSTALLAGCGAVGPVMRPIYVLRPTLGAPPDIAPVRWQLVIAIPDAPASLDSERIAVSRTPDTLDYYADAIWSDRLPLLFQGLVVEAFEASGKLPAVARDTAGIHGDYLLLTELREFDADFSGGATPAAAVRLAVRLVRLPAREIVGSITIEQRAPAGANTVDAAVAAFDQALGAALTQLVAWTLGAGAKS